MVNELVVKDGYLTIEEVAKQLGVHRNTADKLVAKCSDVKGKKGERKFYNLNEIKKIQLSQQQQQLVKVDKKASALVEKTDEIVVANSFKKVLETKTPQEMLAITTQLNTIALQGMVNYTELLQKENDTLKIELGKSTDYYSIKKVAIINNKKEKDYKWSLLKKQSVIMGKEIKTERDNNYANVNSYHIEVWKEVYPNEKY